MPRKDPITGCSVITWGEFWLKEAERNNSTPEEEQRQFWEEWEEDRLRVEDNLRNSALNFLQDGVACYEQDGDYLPFPIKILRLDGAHVGQTFRQSSEEIGAICLAANGKIYEFHRATSYDSGSFYSPPDYDEQLLVYRCYFGKFTVNFELYGKSLNFILGNYSGTVWWSQVYYPSWRSREFGWRLWPFWKRLRKGRLFGISWRTR